TLVAGVKGAALRLPAGSAATISEAGQATPPESGTVDFWMNSAWDGGEGTEHELLSLGGAEGIRIVMDGSGALHFNLPALDGYPISTPSAQIWRHDDWRYLAFSWSRESASIYLDGAMVAQARFRKTPTPPKLMPLVIGGTSADATFDELGLHYVSL